MKEFKTLWSYIKKEKTHYLRGFVGSLFRFLIPLVVPLLFKYLFDHLLSDPALTRAEKLEQLARISVPTPAVFLLLRNPTEYVRQYAIQKANNNIIKALRQGRAETVDRAGPRISQRSIHHITGRSHQCAGQRKRKACAGIDSPNLPGQNGRHDRPSAVRSRACGRHFRRAERGNRRKRQTDTTRNCSPNSPFPITGRRRLRSRRCL